MLLKLWFGKAGFGHFVDSTVLNQPRCKRFQYMCFKSGDSSATLAILQVWYKAQKAGFLEI